MSAAYLLVGMSVKPESFGKGNKWCHRRPAYARVRWQAAQTILLGSSGSCSSTCITMSFLPLQPTVTADLGIHNTNTF